MNERWTSLSPLIFEPVTKILRHSLENFNTHEHFGNWIYFSRKSHILANTTHTARGWIGSPKGIYINAIFSALNCSPDTLVNYFSFFDIYLSLHLSQLLIDSWSVPYCMHISQPHIIWWNWIIFHNFDRRSIWWA